MFSRSLFAFGAATLGGAALFWLPACATQSTKAPVLLPPSGFELAWSDEFNVDGPPDPKKWIFERGFVRNHEAQFYQPDNAVVKLGPGKGFEFNYDYCKGCGVCVAEGPCGAIEMKPEDV